MAEAHAHSLSLLSIYFLFLAVFRKNINYSRWSAGGFRLWDCADFKGAVEAPSDSISPENLARVVETLHKAYYSLSESAWTLLHESEQKMSNQTINQPITLKPQVCTWQMRTRSGANYLHCCVSKFKNVAASDAQNRDGINKTCFTFQTNIKQMISYHAEELNLVIEIFQIHL